MQRLEYDKLIKPYAAPTYKDGPQRTPEGQRKWLEQKKIPADTIDVVMYEVYAGILAGDIYPSGHDLDRHLLERCLQETNRANKAVVKVRQRQINKASVTALKAAKGYRRPSKWLRHPVQSLKWHRVPVVAFLLGSSAVGAAWLLLVLYGR